MCYSFEASLVASVGLATAGVNMVRKSLRLDRRMLVFAFFPLVFACHQLIEAVVWRSMEHPFDESVIFRYAYVMIAFLVWPVLAPLAALVAETNPGRKPFWKFLLAERRRPDALSDRKTSQLKRRGRFRQWALASI